MFAIPTEFHFNLHTIACPIAIKHTWFASVWTHYLYVTKASLKDRQGIIFSQLVVMWASQSKQHSDCNWSTPQNIIWFTAYEIPSFLHCSF